MTGRRLDAAGLDLLRWAVADPVVTARFGSMVVRVPGSECWWWLGAISGRGHGRFWLAAGRVVIAHRFAYAAAVGVDGLAATSVLGHRCDNPLCQRVGPEHVVASSALLNRREWSIRRVLAGNPLADPRGPRRRAQALRDLARQDPARLSVELKRLRASSGEQPPLW